LIYKAQFPIRRFDLPQARQPPSRPVVNSNLADNGNQKRRSADMRSAMSADQE
jgi:hypothetical protein